jgi:hypothetical protein
LQREKVKACTTVHSMEAKKIIQQHKLSVRYAVPFGGTSIDKKLVLWLVFIFLQINT